MSAVSIVQVIVWLVVAIIAVWASFLLALVMPTAILWLIVGYVVLPIDLDSDFIPTAGQLGDATVALALRYSRPSRIAVLHNEGVDAASRPSAMDLVDR
jgi:uncharacterized membrane protein YkvA (DUF1232 family)